MSETRFIVWTPDDELVPSCGSNSQGDAIAKATARYAFTGCPYYVSDSQAEFLTVRVPSVSK